MMSIIYNLIIKTVKKILAVFLINIIDMYIGKLA